MPTPAATSTLTAATHGSALALTADTLTKAATVLLLVTIATALYLLTCLIWPFGTCRRCKGGGKRLAPLGRVFRHCTRCDGTGYRVRIGRHVINHLRATHSAGTNSTSKGRRS